jgi:hypothetical protein
LAKTQQASCQSLARSFFSFDRKRLDDCARRKRGNLSGPKYNFSMRLRRGRKEKASVFNRNAAPAPHSFFIIASATSKAPGF